MELSFLSLRCNTGFVLFLRFRPGGGKNFPRMRYRIVSIRVGQISRMFTWLKSPPSLSSNNSSRPKSWCWYRERVLSVWLNNSEIQRSDHHSLRFTWTLKVLSVSSFQVELSMVGNTARCGSTLICQILSRVPNVLCMSEPWSLNLAHGYYSWQDPKSRWRRLRLFHVFFQNLHFLLSEIWRNTRKIWKPS